MELTLIEILLLFIGVSLLYFTVKMANDIKGIKYTLDQLSNQMDLPENPVNKELRQLINEANDVKAVKKARETLGLSLIEAKQYVDALKFDDK